MQTKRAFSILAILGLALSPLLLLLADAERVFVTSKGAVPASAAGQQIVQGFIDQDDQGGFFSIDPMDDESVMYRSVNPDIGMRSSSDRYCAACQPWFCEGKYCDDGCDYYCKDWMFECKRPKPCPPPPPPSKDCNCKCNCEFDRRCPDCRPTLICPNTTVNVSAPAAPAVCNLTPTVPACRGSTFAQTTSFAGGNANSRSLLFAPANTAAGADVQINAMLFNLTLQAPAGLSTFSIVQPLPAPALDRVIFSRQLSCPGGSSCTISLCEAVVLEDAAELIAPAPTTPPTPLLSTDTTGAISNVRGSVELFGCT